MEIGTYLKSKRKCNKDGFSSPNSIFGCFLLESKVVIHSYQKALALSIPVLVKIIGRKNTIRLSEKLCSDSTKSHHYAVKNPDNGLEAVQS